MLRNLPFIVRILGLVIALVAVLIARMTYHQYRAVKVDFETTPASALAQHPELTGIAGLAEVAFRSQDDVRLAGWYVPSKNRAAVVITHGTNADRASMLAETRILADAGFGVLAFDWPGAGGSAGTVQWNAQERHALTAAIDWLSRRPDLDPTKLGGLGFSMGGYVMAQVAARDVRMRAVVLAAAPTDYGDYIAWSQRRWGVIAKLTADWASRRGGMRIDELRPVAVVQQIAPRPVLIIGGTLDEAIPETMVRRLYAAAGEPKSLWIVPGAHHGGYIKVAAVEYRQRLVDFFNSNLLAPAPG